MSGRGDDRDAMYSGSLEGQLDLLEKENASLKRKLAMQSDLDLQGYEHMRDELLELKTALLPKGGEKMIYREGYGRIKAENLKKEDYPTLMMLACEMHDVMDKTDCENFVTMTITVDGEYDMVLTIGRAGSEESPAEQLTRLTEALKKSTDNFASLNTSYVELEAKHEALKVALVPLVEWWKVEKKLEEKFGSFSDCVLGFTHKGEISNKVTAKQLDAIARMVGDTV